MLFRPTIPSFFSAWNTHIFLFFFASVSMLQSVVFLSKFSRHFVHVYLHVHVFCSLQVASELNAAILEVDATPKLANLLKLLLWSQDEIDKKKIKYPRMTDIGSGTIEDPKWFCDTCTCFYMYASLRSVDVQGQGSHSLGIRQTRNVLTEYTDLEILEDVLWEKGP